MPTLWSSEVSKKSFWNKQKWRNRIMIICFNFLRNKNYVLKISSRNCTLYKFHIKIYLELFIYIWSTTWVSHWTTGSSVKPSTSEVTLSENSPWVPGIPRVWHSFSFFSVITIFEITFCIFVPKCFSCSNSLVPLLFLLCHYIRRYT